jgi:hypothetical protein
MDQAIADQVRSFGIFLTQIADGEIHDQLTEDLRDLVRSIQEAAANSNGSKASGTIKLSIKLKLDRGAFDVVADHSVTKPKTRHSLSLFWATADGMLVRNDPRQQVLPGVRDVSAPPVRTIAG